ncbi:dihydrodipicolinate synthase family protein [Novosphingobium pentaromativorans]|uniref:Dihydrodipicolinate synthetase n=1 Tax=Novosphingobium pentaromativorans US6-1 TaxID=1088721 RepID=G6EGM2_9SPHN|nr:dihydrodipicolinate synthase family protein [Novosphingobium pentaromativorans]AIT82152.1 aldolase [Novosphingobium pentaromativorans US6-1]EHJ59569.1 Dihydrodipicolinate synthetase [Novosphingobium pentaromativorans US6-1]
MTKSPGLLTIDEITGAWAMLPSPATPNGWDWRETDTVDVDEVARATEAMISSGIDGLMGMGTLGECCTMTREERRKFMSTAIDTAAGRVPFIAGATSLGTRDTIEMAREASDMGANGVLLGLPMWCPADTSMAVSYFRDVAEACPDTTIFIYANFAAFRYTWPPAFWAQMADIPQVRGVKYAAGANNRLVNDLNASRGNIRFLVMDMEYYMSARIDPDAMKAFWSSGAACGPEVATHLRDLVEGAKASGDWSKAKEFSDRIAPSMATLFPRGQHTEFAKYNVGLEKERINAGGWMNVGPARPPHHLTPEEYLEGARTSGRIWAQIAEEITAAG